MGYTHYFSFNRPRGQAAKIETKYVQAIAKCVKVVQHYSKEFGGLSGYTAHDKNKTYGGLNVNGSKRVGECETFAMREHFSQNEAGFCKTRQYPYDTVVVACLIILKHYLGDSFEVSSDGDIPDWADGLTLASKVLNIKSLKIPDSIRDRPKLDSYIDIRIA